MAVTRQRLYELKWLYLPSYDWDVSPITSRPPVTGLGEQKEVTVVMYGCESWTVKKAER